MSNAHLNQQRVPPNVNLRLLQRELRGHPCGAAVHTSRAFSECLVPTHKVLQAESPSLHIGKFTADGNALVCFSLQLESVVLLDYQGPQPTTPTPHPAAAASAGGLLQQSVGFHSFFKERWRLPLCSDTEQLCRDFCISLQGGRFLLLASCTSQQARQQQQQQQQGTGAAAAAAAGAGQAAAGQAAAAGRGAPQQRQQQQQLAPDVGPAEEGGELAAAAGSSAPSSDCCDMTTFHVVDVSRCIRVDQRQFPHDHFDLSGNACVSLHGNTLALTSIRKQTIHLLQVNRDGSLTDMQQIGQQCQPDDEGPIELAAAAEQQWQLQRQHERQQQQFWMHQQARALLPPKHCPPSPPCVPQAPPQQPASRQTAAAATGAAGVTGRVRRRADEAGSGGASSSSSEGDEAASADDDSDADSMEEDDPRRRRVRRRLDNAQQPRQQQQQQQQPVRPQQQQQHQQQQQQHQRDLAAAADGGAAAAAAATSAALLDPSHQLITGLRQRLLAHLYRASCSQQQLCDVAPTHRDFHHNFGVLSSLVIWRARLLDRHRLLLKVGAPTSGPAAAADANPNRVHFFGIYDLRSTRFIGFWKAGSAILLSAVLEQPCKLLAAGADLSPVERCCAAALYPAGFPIGLDSAPPHQQQQQLDTQQQPQPHAPLPQQHAPLPALRQTGAGGLGAAAAAAARSVAAEALGRHALPPSPAATAAAHGAAHGGRQRRSSHGGVPHGSSGTARGSSDSSSSITAKMARERLKFLQQVVLMVLPGLQNLSPSPYLDPHLFRYSKHVSPIIGLRNSPTHAIRFQLARQYPGFSASVQQQEVPAAGPAAAGAAGAGQEQQQHRQQQQHHAGVDMLQLDVALPPTVQFNGEEVSRRQLHLFHPSDPFVLVVVQTPGQPATLNIYCRM